MAERALRIVSMKDPADFGLDARVLSVGDRVVEVAGRPAEDQLDFHFHASRGKSVSIKVERADGRVEDVVLPTSAVAGLEIWFEAMDFRRCRCKCPFCFVDQMPKGMRETLYVKDEDFRLSFLYGNFTTMNDMTDEELVKIIEQRNSPQWVSVHAIEEGMRRFIFGRPMKRDIVATLCLLAEGGITVHTQAVIVPGKNDGDYLRETIETLEGIHPNIATLAVVPVGLTRHRSGLASIRAYADDEMAPVIDLVDAYRGRFLAKRASRFVFASDEWYVGAARDVPAFDEYEGFPQLDNGVGSIRHFVREIEEDLDAFDLVTDLSSIRIATGWLGVRVFERYVFPLLRARGVQAPPRLVRVTNDYFGGSVTCSGLLVGRDIVKALREADPGVRGGGAVFIPPNCLNYDGVTIDEFSPDDLAREIGSPVLAPADSFVEALSTYAANRSARA
jgi:putative radical SAM enzyme (TIGR03279 family)